MGIFSRFKDIVSANVSAMLDRAEDPDKLIRLMIREMEETLVELKASCAARMAEASALSRRIAELDAKVATWDARAELAVAKGRDDLAREALAEKRRLGRTIDAAREDLAVFEDQVASCREDIASLESKLAQAREKKRQLASRHVRAGERKSARAQVRRAESFDAARRFERFEQQVERMEAEAELEGPPASGSDLEREFDRLEGGEDVERELAALKKRLSGGSGEFPADGK